MIYSTSQIAKRFGVHNNTILHYEAWGYLSKVERSQNGYRQFTEDHVNQIELIQQIQKLDRVKPYMKFVHQSIIRQCAAFDYDKALVSAKNYKQSLKNDQTLEDQIYTQLNQINKVKEDDRSRHLTRCEVAKFLNVSRHVILYWERNGLLEAPRGKNGYRYYGTDEIRKLNIIKELRQYHYSTSTIRDIVQKDINDHPISSFKDNLSAIEAIIKTIEKNQTLHCRTKV